MPSFKVGIIAEDKSDVESIKEIVRKIKKRNNLSFSQFYGGGCALLVRKCNGWAGQLLRKGCTHLLVIHDSDGNPPQQIVEKIRRSLGSSPIAKHVISVPVQEIEAWLLSDPNAIKAALNLKRLPRISNSVEDINSPKEFLGELILNYSDQKVIYANTIHNEKIAKALTLQNLIDKCPSFQSLHDFVSSEVR